MSIKALGWAFEQRVRPSSVKFILVALADFANDNGECFPSISTICNKTEQHEDTVRRAISSLIEMKFLVDTGRKVGASGQVKVYQFPEFARELKTPKNRGLKPTGETRGRLVEDPVKPGTEPVTSNLEVFTIVKTKKKWASDFEIPIEFQRDDFNNMWNLWISERRQSGKPISYQASILQFETFKRWGIEKSIQSMSNSIEKGYVGLHEPKFTSRSQEDISSEQF